MKILILTSGGDAQGMNKVIYEIYKKFKSSAYACKYGFRGLIENNIIPLKDCQPFRFRNSAGSCIKCSRCPEFATVKGFKKGLTNAKNFDFVIILGGNGSYKGACQLANNGVKTIFIPATIDNDVDISEYSLGFHSAVRACCEYIKNTMPSMEAFNRCCIFEVMGRHHNAIAKSCAKALECDFVVSDEKDLDYNKISKIIKSKNNEEKSSILIIRENILPLDTFASNLKNISPKIDIKALKIGHIQRGWKPTKRELYLAKLFSKQAIKEIKRGCNCSASILINGKVVCQKVIE